MSMQLLSARWVVTVEPSGQVLENHTVVVDDGKIVDVLPTDEAKIKYGSVPDSQRWEGKESVLLPGFVNCHTHSAMTLLRGIADDLSLMPWLHEHIWPAEGALVSPDFVYDGTKLAMAEMLRSGTTCFNDMYFFPDAVGKATNEAGMRASLGIICIGFPSAYCGDPAASMTENIKAYLDKGEGIAEAEFSKYPLVSVTVAPHAPYTVGSEGMTLAKAVSDKLGLPLHIHLHESETECSDWEGSNKERPVATMKRLGLINEKLVAVHMTQMTTEEINVFAEAKASIIHCPESNMKLASGTCPVSELLAAGINVGLGTDGCASNNDLDMYGEMRSAAFLAKLSSKDPTSVPAQQALHMATMGSAKALGIDDAVGSLVVGKQADIQAVDLSGIESVPLYSVISHLVYCTSRTQVTDVWVAGKQLVKARRLTTLDEEGIIAKAREWATKAKQHATVPPVAAA